VQDPKDGINPYFTAFYVSNTKVPLVSMSINGQEYARQEFNFYTGGAVGDGPYTIKLVGENGEELVTKVDDLFKTIDLGVQFGGDAPAAAGR
jgi:expansin (peptidoglycan-binding protein)